MTISVRPLFSSDAVILDAFLAPHTAESYYLRSNALAAGLAYEGKPLQAEYLGAFDDGCLVGALAYSWMNTILLYAENLESLPLLAQAVRPLIEKRGGLVEAVLGVEKQVAAVLSILAVPRSAFRRWDADALFHLVLDRLQAPALPKGCVVRLAEEKDSALLIDWRVAFNIEANGAAPGAALAAAVEKEVEHWLKSKHIFILERAGVPVAFCGVGGSVPEAVIVGPVWTPPEHRGRGYAKLVAGHGLKIQRNENRALREATLFASRPDAIRVYEALGFRRIADWRLALLREDYRIQVAS